MKFYLIVGIATLLTFVICWPISTIGMIALIVKGIYDTLKKLIAYNAECKAKYNAQYNVQDQTFRERSKPLTQQSFEEWKAAREKAQAGTDPDRPGRAGAAGREL